jgi:hypothetical protein
VVEEVDTFIHSYCCCHSPSSSSLLSSFAASALLLPIESLIANTEKTKAKLMNLMEEKRLLSSTSGKSSCRRIFILQLHERKEGQ